MQQVNVVHQQKDLHAEVLLAEALHAESLLVEALQAESLLVVALHAEGLLAEALQKDQLHEEGDVNLPSFFLNNRLKQN